jgi:fibronectin type 3 domain-containing protein
VSPTLPAISRYPDPDRARARFRWWAWALILALLLAALGTGAFAGLHRDARSEKTADGASAGTGVTWALLDPPPPPSNLRASAGDGRVDLSWDASGDLLVIGYNIYRGESPGGESKIASILLFTTYTDTSVQNGVTYWYYVTARTLTDESDPSNEVSATPEGPPPPPPPTVPGPPQNLNAQGGDGAVYLTWDAPGDNGGSPITYYHIYRGTSPDQLSQYDSVGGDARAYTDSGVTNGQTYWYRVSAENDVGEGPWSNLASATPEAPPSPPGPPVNLQATAGDGSVELDWTAPTDNGGSPITNYRIYRGTTSGQLALLAEVPDVRTYLDTGLTNGVKYFYHVTAVNAAGEGPPSAEVSATPRSANTPPDPPVQPVAIGGDARVSLSWQTPGSNGGSPITNYKIYRGTSPGGESWLATVGGDVLSYTDTAVTNGVTFYYYVTAVNIVGEGGFSNEVSATPMAAASVPDAARNLTAEPMDSGVHLAWLRPTDTGGKPITNYKIYRGTSSGDRSTVTTAGNVTSYTDLGLQNGQQYYYVVTAVNEIGEGPPSNEVSSTPATVPSAPRNLRAIEGDGAVTIQWSGPQSDGGSAVTNFRIYRGTTSGNLVFLTMIGPIDSYTDEKLLNDQTYYYQVSALNRAGEGQRSDPASATPSAGRTVPDAPQALIATAGNRSVRLDWSAPATNGGSPIINYTVYRGVEAANLTRFNSGVTALTMLDATVTNGVTYYYEVTAVNAIGEGPRSPLASATPREGAGGLDATKPKVAITSPPAEETVPAGSVSVYGTASDDTAVVRVEVSPDGTTWSRALGTAAWSARISLPEGKRTIYAQVIDSAGNMGATSVNVTVKPGSGPGPAGGAIGGDNGATTIALAVGSFVVSAGVAWFILDRRRRFWKSVLGSQRRERKPLFEESPDDLPQDGTGPPSLQGTVPEHRSRP